MTDENVNPETNRLQFQRGDVSLLLRDMDALSEQFKELNLHSIASPNIKALKSIENVRRTNSSNDRMISQSVTFFKASENQNRGMTTHIKIDTPYKKNVLVRLRNSPEETDFMKKRVVLLKSDKAFAEDDVTTLQRELTEDLEMNNEVKTKKEDSKIIETSSVCHELFGAFGLLKKDIVSTELPSHHNGSRVPFLSECCSRKKSVDISWGEDDLTCIAESFKQDLGMQDNSAPMADIAQKMETQTTITQHSAITVDNEPHNEREARSMDVVENTSMGEKIVRFNLGLIKNENFEFTRAEKYVEDDNSDISSEFESIHSYVNLNEDVTGRVSIGYPQNDANSTSQTLDSADSTPKVDKTLESIKPNKEYSVTSDVDLTSKLTFSESNSATYADYDDDHSSDFESINSDSTYVGNQSKDLGEENQAHKVNETADVGRISPPNDCRIELCFRAPHSPESTASFSNLEIPIMDCAQNVANVSGDFSVESTDDTTKRTQVEYQGELLKTALSVLGETLPLYNEKQFKLEMKDALKEDGNASTSDLSVEETDELILEKLRYVQQHKNIKNALRVIDKKFPEYSQTKFKLEMKDTLKEDVIIAISNSGGGGTDEAKASDKFMIIETPPVELGNNQENMSELKYELEEATRINVLPYTGGSMDEEKVVVTEMTRVEHQDICLQAKLSLSQTELKSKDANISNCDLNVTRTLEVEEMTYMAHRRPEVETAVIEEKFLEESHISQLQLESKNAAGADSATFINDLNETETLAVEETTYMTYRNPEVEAAVVVGKPLEDPVDAAMLDSTTFISDPGVKQITDITKKTTEHHSNHPENTITGVEIECNQMSQVESEFKINLESGGYSNVKNTVDVTEMIHAEHKCYDVGTGFIKESSLKCSPMSQFEKSNNAVRKDPTSNSVVRELSEVTETTNVRHQSNKAEILLMQKALKYNRISHASKWTPAKKVVDNTILETTEEVGITFTEHPILKEEPVSLEVSPPKPALESNDDDRMNVVTLISDSSVEDTVKITETTQLKVQQINFEATLPRNNESSLECNLISPLELRLKNYHEDVNDFSSDSSVKERVKVTKSICVEFPNGQAKGELMQVTSPECNRIPPDLKLENVAFGNVNAERTDKMIETIRQERQSHQFQTTLSLIVENPLEFSQVPTFELGKEKDLFRTPKVRRHHQSTRRESLVNELRKNLNKLLTPIREKSRRNTDNSEDVEELIEIPSFKYEISKDPSKTRLVMEMPVSLLDLSIGSLERMSTDIPVHPTDVEESSSEILIEKDKLIKVLEQKNNELLEENVTLQSQLEEANESNKSLKSVCQILHKNEQLLKKAIEEFENINRTLSNRYDMLREYADKKICQLNAELEEIKTFAVK